MITLILYFLKAHTLNLKDKYRMRECISEWHLKRLLMYNHRQVLNEFKKIYLYYFIFI